MNELKYLMTDGYNYLACTAWKYESAEFRTQLYVRAQRLHAMGQTTSGSTSVLWSFLSAPKPDEPGYSNRQTAFASAKLAQKSSSKSKATYN